MFTETVSPLPVPRMVYRIPRWMEITYEATQAVFNELRLYAQAHQIDVRDLLRQALLHAPRLSNSTKGFHPRINDEVIRLFWSLVEGRRSVPTSTYIPFRRKLALDDLSLGVTPAEVSNTILAHYHYLRSPRDLQYSLGLFPSGFESSNEPLALFTLSRLDLPHLSKLLPDDINANEALVLSRIYACPTAPANAISFGLRLVRQWLSKTHPEIRLLLTYLNPNVGFDASSLRAANWTLFCEEVRRHYLYLDTNYITERECTRRFGTDYFPKLQPLLGERISRSLASLRPLEVYAFSLHRRDRHNPKFTQFPSRMVGPRVHM